LTQKQAKESRDILRCLRFDGCRTHPYVSGSDMKIVWDHEVVHAKAALIKMIET
jgi:hypothetical protein